MSLGIENKNCKLALYDNGSGDDWYGIGASNYNLTFGAGLTAGGNPQMKLRSDGTLTVLGNISAGASGAAYGYSILSVGNTEKPGYTGYYDASNVRAGYVGWSNSGATGTGSRSLELNAEGSLYGGWVTNKNFKVIGDFSCNTSSTSSDYRIKENVKDLDTEVYNIDKLRPVSYLNKLNNKKSLGLIAHELQEHFPFLVNGEKDAETNQSIDYIGLIAVLIKEIQELKKEVKMVKENLKKE